MIAFNTFNTRIHTSKLGKVGSLCQSCDGFVEAGDAWVMGVVNMGHTTIPNHINCLFQQLLNIT